jgi:hypothetical protein
MATHIQERRKDDTCNCLLGNLSMNTQGPATSILNHDICPRNLMLQWGAQNYEWQCENLERWRGQGGWEVQMGKEGAEWRFGAMSGADGKKRLTVKRIAILVPRVGHQSGSPAIATWVAIPQRAVTRKQSQGMSNKKARIGRWWGQPAGTSIPRELTKPNSRIPMLGANGGVMNYPKPISPAS